LINQVHPDHSNSDTAKTTEDDPTYQYLTFQLTGETYGINIKHVREIIEYGFVTPIPMMPKFIIGVINLRGSVVPVLDLNARFGGQNSVITKRTSVVIIELTVDETPFQIGVVLDFVNDVLEINKSNIAPPPTFGAQIRTDFIEGMGKINEEFLILINTERVLDTNELSMISNCASIDKAS